MERPAGAESKAWGWAEEITRQTVPDDPSKVLCRNVRVFIKRGGYSSIHRHNQCANIFAVISGRLFLRRLTKFAPHSVEAEWVQEANDHPITFRAGELHQFEALTDVRALEIYIAIPGGDASASDIERFSQNGCKP